ncbi:MAG: BREX-2 system phosphatase PglZ [Verrucomicrobiaceae bacterium]|nr:BREX-2 system phosphatase PglZ [Verrucomicrobiaceae bacterium]
MPALTPPILSAQVKAARAKTRAGRPLAFRSYDTWSGDETLAFEDKHLTVKECRSDLETREAMGLGAPDELVLLVRASDGLLAEDTLSRCAKGRLLDLNPRDTLLNLAGAQAIDPRLLLHRDVIDLLVQRWRADVRLTSSANVIECGRAFAFLLGRPELATEPPDLLGLLLWSLDDGLAAVLQAPPAVQSAFFDWLRETNGTALVLIEQALKDNAARLVSLGLVLGAVFPAEGMPSEAARNATIRLERYLGDVKVIPSAAQAWHRASKAVLGHVDSRLQHELLRDVDAWLDELKASELASESEFSPNGFNLRLDALAAALQTARRGDSAKSWDALLDAEKWVKSHWMASVEGARLEVIRMALRLTKWLRQLPAAENDEGLGSLASAFLADGAFVDWARQKLRRGDGRETLNKAYTALLSKVDERREETNALFGSSLQRWIAKDSKDDGIIPIENVIEEVIVPLAKNTKVLLLVMDGMSGAVFAELMTDLESRGWHSMRTTKNNIPRPVIAALPCITAVSRAALFRGRLDAKDTTTEVVNFREHPSLHRSIQSKSKPQLFLKPSLADAGGAGLSSEVRDAIAEPDSRVVGVVINAVDDQLSTLGQLAIDWKVNQITWLKDLLDAAVVGQRAVVLISDHGHVPAKETDRSLQLKNAAGDRHRIGPPEAKEGELLVSGPRLQAATGTNDWIFSQSERLRYGGKKSGYHGGVADQEVVVPLAVLSASSEDIGDFEATDFKAPEWWAIDLPASSPGIAGQPAATSKTRKKKAAVGEAPPLELWAATGAEDTEVVLSTPPLTGVKGETPAWVPALLKSDVMKQQKSLANRVQIAEDMISSSLALLESRAGVVPVAVLARELNLPQFRVGGFVAQLQRILNVEGYLVLETDTSQTLRLNRELLFKQFDIKP